MGIQARVRAVLNEGHRNLAYSIVRTAPLSKRSLDFVPAGAAAVAIIGLNPAGNAAARGSDRASTSVTAMDIGREVFANVEEVSLFGLLNQGAESPRAMPDLGMVAAVKDPAKSEALWDQLLSLAAMFGPQVAGPPQEIEIEGRRAKQYQFAHAPPIIVVRLGDRAIGAGTRGAVAAALRAERSGASITGDPQFQPLLAGLRAETSKAFLAHAARLIAVAQSAGPKGPDDDLKIAALVGDLRLMIATHEKPNELVVQAIASGLPNVPRIIQASLGRHSNKPAGVVRGRPLAHPRPVETSASTPKP
jgi:hypothetical protein